MSSHQHDELVAARPRIAKLEAELAVVRRTAELPKEAGAPFDGFAAIL